MEKRDKKISELSSIIKDKKEKKGQIIKATKKINKLKNKNRKSFNLVVKYKNRIHYDLSTQEPTTCTMEEIMAALKPEVTRPVTPSLPPSPVPTGTNNDTSDSVIKDEHHPRRVRMFLVRGILSMILSDSLVPSQYLVSGKVNLLKWIIWRTSV